MTDKVIEGKIVDDKVIRDGMVAVLVSPGYGAGWSTWSSNPSIMFDPAIVEWVENGKVGHPPTEEYPGGLGEVEIHWLPVGAKFRIDEYDGHETLVRASQEVWTEA